MTDRQPRSEIKTGLGTTILVDNEFRRLYRIVLVFLILVSLLLCTVGVFTIWSWWDSWNRIRSSEWSLTSGVLYLVGGILVFIVAMTLRQLRRYLVHVREEAAAKIRSVELSKLNEQDFDKAYEILEIRDEKAQADYQRNRSDAFLITSFEMHEVDFFGNCGWRPQPGVNVLLGRNGYGKSLILRSIAALLQNDRIASTDLFDESSNNAFMQLELQRNGTSEIVRCVRQRFVQSPGPIPILAIPDSRFVNRSSIDIKASIDDTLDLGQQGAKHFLEHLPYGEMMDMLFTELCLDYWERGSFDSPGFNLLEKSLGTLTGEQFRFHSVERVGRTAFHLFVVSEGNSHPLPIQYASQGTLSVLGVLGIIRSYLRDLFPDATESELLKKPAIILIDELDAHLHPLWQQKLSSILRDNFPNTQFILTAHSPLVVAGCWSGEVTVLRRQGDGFALQQLERDFVGSTAEVIFKTIFDIEQIDHNFLALAGRATYGFSNQPRMTELESKEQLTDLEHREFTRLVREESMIRRAAEVKAERRQDANLVLKLEAQVNALQDKLNDNTTETA